MESGGAWETVAIQIVIGTIDVLFNLSFLLCSFPDEITQ